MYASGEFRRILERNLGENADTADEDAIGDLSFLEES